MHAIFGILTALATIVAFTPYILDILKGKTKPERASWLIWALLASIAFFSQFAEGARWSLLMPGTDFFVLCFIFVLAVKFGSGGLPKRDIISLLVAVLSLVLWAITKQPLTALLIVIGIDMVAVYLMIYKSYREPDTETLFSWVLSSIGGIFAALAVSHLSFSLLVYPLYIVLADGSVAVTVLLGRSNQKTKLKPSRREPPRIVPSN